MREEDNEAENTERPRYGFDRPEYLASHKSLAACQRELTRLTTSLTAQVQAIADQEGETATIRRSPDRCILQLGPVALSVAWLRSTMDSVAEGQLLVMVWNGTIASRPKYSPERPGNPASTASIIWQDALAAEANDENSWAWRSESTGSAPTEKVADVAVAELKKALKKAKKLTS
jgi:hypothetical protein